MTGDVVFGPALIIGIFAWQWLYRSIRWRRRVERLQALAGRLGWEYSPSRHSIQTTSLPEICTVFTMRVANPILMPYGARPLDMSKSLNCLTGTWKDVVIGCCDFRWRAGKNRTVTKTCFFLRTLWTGVSFRIQPLQSTARGYPVIAGLLENFAKRYYVEGLDERQVARFLTPALQDWLQDHMQPKPWYIACTDGWLMAHRYEEVDAEDFRFNLDLIVELQACIRGSA